MVIARRGGGRARGYQGRTTSSPSAGNTDEDEEGTICSQDHSYSIFLADATFSQHFDAQNLNRDQYIAILVLLQEKHIQLSSVSKPKALAAAWARHDWDMAKMMLSLPEEQFSLKEVLKAVTILDSARLKRANEKLLRRLETQGCKKRNKMAHLRSTIGSLPSEIPVAGSVSGAVTRQVKSWLKTIPAGRLEFFALHFPSEPWKKLADICHINPEKDVPQCPWFFNFVFGKELPVEQLSETVQNLTAENISARIMEADIDYTIARKFKDNLTDGAKERIANYTPKLDTVLWYYEELYCPSLNIIIKRRLENGEKLEMPYGKLMERLDTFLVLRRKQLMDFIDLLFPIANQGLQRLSLCLDAPVVVIGDKSSSMSVAIRTSNIIASLISRIADAELVFFDSDNQVSPFIPQTVEQVMDLSEKIRASGCTSPAASLYPYYKDKKIVKTFVMVTDEGENAEHEGHRFAGLFKEYHEQVYPACLVFISFVNHQSQRTMVNELKQIAPEVSPLCFSFSQSRPDLSRLDHILGVLSLKADTFTKEVEEMQNKIKEGNLNDVLQSLMI